MINPIEILLRAGIDRDTARTFVAWHIDHPDIWREFEKLALELIQSGRARYGSKAVMEVIRFNRVVSGGEDFKVNNNYTAYYVRIFNAKYPQHKRFFETREIVGLRNAA
jgi:hypothetical protein